jgi:hypothetical protein
MATTSAPCNPRLYPDQVDNLVFISGLNHRKNELLN